MSEQQQEQQGSSGIIVYISSTPANREIRKNQQRVMDVLGAKKIAFEVVDISSTEEGKQKMKAAGPKGKSTPQIFKWSEYLGAYEEFEEAVETENLAAFLKSD